MLEAMEGYSVQSLHFWRAYLVLMRPYLLFISGITGLLGMALAQASFSPLAFILFTIFFFSYGIGQALTDCFQIDTDSISSPYRPLVTGELSRRSVIITSLVFLSVAGLILTSVNYYNLPVAVLAVLGLLTYTFFKRRFWGGPFYNAWIVAALCIMAIQSFTSQAWFDYNSFCALLTVVFAYAHFVLVGYFKDIEADRATAYNTFPVVYGRRLAAHVSGLLGVGALAFAFLTLNAAQRVSFLSLLVFALAFVAYLTSQILLYRNNSDETAFKPIIYSVHAYLLVIAALVIHFKYEWFAFVVAYYLCFNLVLSLRPCKSQI